VRLLLVTPQYLPDVSGSTLLLQSIVNRLNASGHGTDVLTYAGDDIALAGTFDSGQSYSIHRVAERKGYAGSSAVMLARLIALTARKQYDQVLAGFAFPSAILAHCASRVTGTPYAVYSHGEDVTCVGETGWKRRMLSPALRRAKVVMANSRFTANAIAKLGVDSDRVLWMPPGVETGPFLQDYSEGGERLRARWRLGGCRIMLTVARLEPRKGQDTVIRALPELLRAVPDAHYVVAGKGDPSPLIDLARTLGVEAHVSLVGFVAEADLPALYSLCDVYAMVSRYDPDSHHVEGFGIVYLEAALCGKPSVAGSAGGCGDVVEDGVTGLLVDPESPSEVAAALQRLLTSPEYAARLGRTARARALREFDRAHILDRIEQTLTSSTGSGRAPTRFLGGTDPSCSGRSSRGGLP
jgi:phosphatidylinositol alpha-1,6-mannosyltransferase